MIPAKFRNNDEFHAALPGAKWTSEGRLASDHRYVFLRVDPNLTRASLRPSVHWSENYADETARWSFRYIFPVLSSPDEARELPPGVEVLGDASPPLVFRRGDRIGDNGTSVLFSLGTALDLLSLEAP